VRTEGEPIEIAFDIGVMVIGSSFRAFAVVRSDLAVVRSCVWQFGNVAGAPIGQVPSRCAWRRGSASGACGRRPHRAAHRRPGTTSSEVLENASSCEAR
jgi:hypothetical protein